MIAKDIIKDTLLELAAKSVTISDREKLSISRACAWLFANKSLAPRGIAIES